MRFSFVAVLLSAALSSYAQSAPDLGFAASFAVLGRSVTNVGSTTVLAGNAGGNTVTGLSRPNFILGDPRENDALEQQAQRDRATVYDALSRIQCRPLTSDTPPPGVYCVQGGTLPPSLTLDAGGNSGAIWIFQVPGSLTTKPGSTVQTTNEGRDNNVYWQVTGAATFGANSVFAGNVLAAGDIRVESNATISGRLLTPGALSLTDAGVTICCELLDMTPHLLPNGMTGIDYTQSLTPKDGTGATRFILAASDFPTGVATLTEGGVLSVRRPAAGVYKLAIAVTDSRGISCIRVYRLVICGPITLSALDPPEPLACLPYSRTITADGGTAPYTFISTALPDGLHLSSSGELAGTPRRVQDYDFTVVATDVFGCTGSRRYMEYIVSIFKLLPETDTLPEGAVGVEYRQAFVVTGASGPFTFTFTGSIPPGLGPSPPDTLTGTPTTGGCYKFTVTVRTDACDVVVSREYMLIIRPVPVLFTPVETMLPAAAVCEPYCQEFSVSACTGTYVFDSMTGELPPGLTFDPTTRKLCGTPSAAGSYSFTLFARDGGHIASHPYELVVQPHEVTIDRELPTATACVYYNHQLSPTGCNPPSCTFTPGPGDLPPGLKISESGLLYDTPTVPGNYTFNVTVKPKDCPSVTVELHLIVLCHVKISPTVLSNGRLGIFYSRTLSASCGTPPYTFTLVSGSLPPGLALSPAGTISGIPAVLGCFNFRVRATDSATPACFSEQTYQICIFPVAAGAPVLSRWGMGILMSLLMVAGLAVMQRAQ